MEEEVEMNVEVDDPVADASGSNLKQHGNFGGKVEPTVDKTKQDQSEETCQKKVYKFVESTPVIIFMMIVTIWALFGDDIRQVTVDVNGDGTFYIITLICFSLFAIEIVLQFIGNPDYRWGFFFYLDVISTVSLLLDVGFISELIFSSGASSNTKSAASFAKTARASRIGTRAGRVVRIIRLIRLIRIVKLYKASQQAQEKRLEQQRKESEKKKQARSVGQQSGVSSGEGANKNSSQKLGQDSNSLAHKSNLNKSSGNIAGNPNKESRSQLGRPPSKTLDDSELRLGAVSNSDKLSQGDGAFFEDLDDLNEDDIFQETHVGKKLSDLTTKRVIILILSIMISIPVFSTDTYFTDYTSYQSGVENLLFLLNMNPTPNNFASNQPFVTAWKSFINIHTNPNENEVLKNITLQYSVSEEISNDLTSAIHAVAGTATKLTDGDLNNLRDADKDVVVAPEIGDDATVVPGTYSITATFDQSKINNLNGYLGIGRTIFVCVVLTASAMFFSKDANELVLSPIEKMLSKVKSISKNPLKAAKAEDKIDIIFEDLRTSDHDNFETTILEKTIAKIGALLALGFGEAGSQIIANNLQPSGEINPMLPGRSVVAIFGFVDIKNFTVITEVLQEGIMMFVNEVADVVHNVVENYNGRANKNIGDSFLFVWKFAPEDCQEGQSNTYQAIKNKKTQAIAELALLSFASIQSELKKSSRIDKYTKNPNLVAKLGNNASRFELRMGFGLHMGWAIESAIGSEFKVDASYLSPSVSIASKLEALTKHYGVSILISEDVLEMLRDPLHGFLRQLDFIKMRHAKRPFGIYTLDLNLATLIVEQEQQNQKPLSAKERRQKRVDERKEKNTRITNYLEGKTSAKEFMNSHQDLVEMRKFFKKEFFMEWDKGMSLYLEGNFEEAKSIFQVTSTMLTELTNEDAPSERLISIMESYAMKAPENWDEGRDVDDILD